MVLAASEFAATLSNERLRLTLAVRDWLVGEAHDISDAPHRRSSCAAERHAV